MKDIIKLNELDKSFFRDIRPITVLGFFDGVHKGHQSILEECLKDKEKTGRKSVVFTFVNHPSEVLQDQKAKRMILSFEEKARLIFEMGIDNIVATEFDRDISKLSPGEFCENIISSKLHASEVIIGENYRFGRNGQGNIDYLKKYYEGRNTAIKEIRLLKIDGSIVSSTNIRKLISEGKVSKAAMMLGRAPYISGVIIQDKGMGRDLGFPTVNLKPPINMVTPKDGVYAGSVSLEGQKPLRSVVNIGNNPTFKQQKKIIEAHILDFDSDLYGKKINIGFLKRLRDEKEFKNIKELTNQIKKDIISAEKFFKEIYATNL